MLKAAHAYNLVTWVLPDFPTFVVVVAYTLKVSLSLPLLSFVLQVHLDPWGLHARHAVTLPQAGPIGSEKALVTPMNPPSFCFFSTCLYL